MAAESRPNLRAWIFGTEQLRAGWRIILFVILFAALTWVIQIVTSSLVRLPPSWSGLVAPLAGAVLAGGIMLRAFDGRPVGALGFPLWVGAWREVIAGFGFGAVLILGATLLLVVTGTVYWVTDTGDGAGYARTLLGGVVFFGLAAALEEALFRGYPFQVLVQGIGGWPAILLTSALFGVAHASNPNVTALALVNIALAGVWLALAYLRTWSLWFATAAHAGWNWTMATLLDFPVSGLVLDTPLYNVHEAGADWWTGGAFGPEAGLAAALVMVLGTAWLLRTRAIGPSERMRELRPLVDARLGK